MANGGHFEKWKIPIEQYLLTQRHVRVKSAIHRVGKSRIICYVIYFTYFTQLNRKYYKNKNWLQFLFIVKATSQSNEKGQILTPGTPKPLNGFR